MDVKYRLRHQCRGRDTTTIDADLPSLKREHSVKARVALDAARSQLQQKCEKPPKIKRALTEFVFVEEAEWCLAVSLVHARAQNKCAVILVAH